MNTHIRHSSTYSHKHTHTLMGRLILEGPLKSQVSFAEYRLFYRSLLQKRPIIVRSLLVAATPYKQMHARTLYTSPHINTHRHAHIHAYSIIAAMSLIAPSLFLPFSLFFLLSFGLLCTEQSYVYAHMYACKCVLMYI